MYEQRYTTGGGRRNTGSNNLNTPEMLLRWLQDVRDLRPGIGAVAALKALARTEGYPRLFHAMNRFGIEIREEATAYWHRRWNKTTVPDVIHGPVPYSGPRLLEGGTACHGVSFVASSPGLTRALPDEVWKRQRPLLAWLRTFAKGAYTQPLLVMEDGPAVPLDVRVFEAAATFGVFLREEEMYRSFPYDYTLYLPEPQADLLVTPLAHAFARGFLNVDYCPHEYGPDDYRCYCATLRRDLNAVPDEHPYATGSLDADLAREELERQQRLGNIPLGAPIVPIEELRQRRTNPQAPQGPPQPPYTTPRPTPPGTTRLSNPNPNATDDLTRR